MDFSVLFPIFLSLLLIGFFASIEIVFVSVNKLSIELRKKQGTFTGKVWGQFSSNSGFFIATILTGLTIMLVLYGLLIGQMLYPIWHLIAVKLPALATNYVEYIKLFVETILSSLIVVFVVVVFKSYSKAQNEGIVGNGVITYIARFFYNLLQGTTTFFLNTGQWILKYVFNVKLNGKNVIQKVDLEHFIQQTKNNDNESSEMNKELFENALSIGEIRIRECLIPRKEVEAVSKYASIEEVKNKFISTQLSKLIVYDQNIDSIAGYIHQLDLFKNPQSINEILLPIPTVPESMNATELMSKFSKERKSVAWVVDEFGGTAGIVTMEDLLEEIFGDIQDEYDTEEFVDKQLSANEFIFSGRLELDFITEKYHLVFDDSEDTETLSGYIIQNNEDIPKQKDRIIIGNYEFDILSVSHTRIETVKLKVLK